MFDRSIRDFAVWTPRAPAVLLPNSQVSYAQFNADIDRLGRALLALGVTPERGVVSLAMDNGYVHWAMLCALARLGVVSSPHDDEDADLKIVSSPGDAGPVRRDLLALPPSWLQDALGAPHVPLPVLNPDPDAVVRVMLSSGTTRKPKRVAATWRRTESVVLGNIGIYSGPARAVWVPLTGVDSLMGYAMGLCAWRLGAAVTAGIGADRLPLLMEQHATGIAVVTPTLLRTMLAALPAGFRPRAGWRLQVGGSVLPVSLAQEAALRMSPDVWVGYGATESSCLATGPALSLADAPGAVGVVVGGAEVEIVGDDGAIVPDGDSGELRVRGTRTADGYVGDPEATRAVFRDGWYYTRDIARRLADGRLVIEGRADERMNLGGRKLMPIVLEEPAHAHPAVLDCAAFAVRGQDDMDQAWLAVVIAAGFERDQLIADLAAFPDMPPLRIAWTDEIPRNAMGKVERARLSEAVLRARGGQDAE